MIIGVMLDRDEGTLEADEDALVNDNSALFVGLLCTRGGCMTLEV